MQPWKIFHWYPYVFPENNTQETTRQKQFPQAWMNILKKNVPLYSRLPAEDREELHGHIQIFLAEKYFEGCGGLTITEEMRVTIAAQACILLLHRKTEYYPKLVSILVYPNTYLAHHRERDGAGLVTEGMQQRVGESWSHGTVVLSWDDVRAGASHANDGHNVVYHEFAHQLDIEDGPQADGFVALPRQSMYGAWVKAGATPEEICHAIILLASTIGFPTTTAALSWAYEVLKQEGK